MDGRPRQRWSRRAVLAAIAQRRSQRLPLHYSAVIAEDEPLLGAARRLFGSWNDALQAAGINPEKVRNPRDGMLPQGTWSPELVLERVRWHAEQGHDLAAHRMQAIDSKLVAAALAHFGSWRRAIRRAGFDYELVCKRRHWTSERVVQRLNQLHKEGADLSHRTAEAWDKGFLAMAVAHFGSWEGALRAAGLQEQRRTVRWTKERVLEAIAAGRPSERGDGLRKAAIRLFGSWEEAVRVAGRPPDQPAEVRVLLREVRHRLGLSLEEVGRRIGYSHRAVSMIELGQWRDPRVSLALKLVEALGVAVEDLFQLP
jgi:DNA-binding XRE family transcriptional regulator